RVRILRIEVADQQIARWQLGDEPILPRDAEPGLGDGVVGFAGGIELLLKSAGIGALAGKDGQCNTDMVHRSLSFRSDSDECEIKPWPERCCGSRGIGFLDRIPA